MPLLTVAQLLQDAEAGSYAVGAFNCNNMEIVQAIVAAARAEKSPVIIQASQGAITYAGLGYIATLVKAASLENPEVPMALHLDHGTSFGQVVRCIRFGFSSVMVDGSKMPLSENIALTSKVLEVARIVGVSVEAEIGRIGGTEDDVSTTEREAAFTVPEEAAEFVARAPVDSLAVAIGTAHGRYRGEPCLDYRRLKRIRELVRLPIVLHGSSGVPDEAIQEAIAFGVRKINIDTNIREAFVAGLRSTLAEFPEEIDPRKLLSPVRESMQAIVQQKMRVFGCSGRT